MDAASNNKRPGSIIDKSEQPAEKKECGLDLNSVKDEPDDGTQQMEIFSTAVSNAIKSNADNDIQNGNDSSMTLTESAQVTTSNDVSNASNPNKLVKQPIDASPVKPAAKSNRIVDYINNVPASDLISILDSSSAAVKNIAVPESSSTSSTVPENAAIDKNVPDGVNASPDTPVTSVASEIARKAPEMDPLSNKPLFSRVSLPQSADAKSFSFSSIFPRVDVSAANKSSSEVSTVQETPPQLFNTQLLTTNGDRSPSDVNEISTYINTISQTMFSPMSPQNQFTQQVPINQIVKLTRNMRKRMNQNCSGSLRTNNLFSPQAKPLLPCLLNSANSFPGQECNTMTPMSPDGADQTGPNEASNANENPGVSNSGAVAIDMDLTDGETFPTSDNSQVDANAPQGSENNLTSEQNQDSSSNAPTPIPDSSVANVVNAISRPFANATLPLQNDVALIDNPFLRAASAHCSNNAPIIEPVPIMGAIAHKNHPAKLINPHHVPKILMILANLALSSRVQMEGPPMVENGGIVFPCRNEFTIRWLIDTVMTHPGLASFEVKAGLARELLTAPRIKLLVPNGSPAVDVAKVLSGLKNQNDLTTEMWGFYGSSIYKHLGRNKHVGIEYVFYIELTDLNALRALNLRPYLGLDRVDVKVLYDPAWANPTPGMVVTAATENSVRTEFTVTEEMSNLGGGLHGGAAATIADVVSSIGVMLKGNEPGVSVNLSMNYLKAAKIGDEIIVDSETLKVGKSLAYCDIKLKRKKDNELIAIGTHVKYVGGATPNINTPSPS